MIRFDQQELATVLAALRMFQRHYEDHDAFEIRRDWPEHFKTNGGRVIKPLGTEDIDSLCERINTENGSHKETVTTDSKKKPCHHPQGGFCPDCVAPGLTPTLTREQVAKIDEFAAYWIEDETMLPALAAKLRKVISADVAADRQATRVREAR